MSVVRPISLTRFGKIMNSKSDSIFHFTKNIRVLKSILKDGFWPRYCREDVSQLTAEQFDYVSFPMVCFCDIPLSRIKDHVGYYGKFGIGLTRSWAERNGLNPILYLSAGNKLTKEMLNLNFHANKLQKEDKEKAKITMRYIFAHSKPSEGMTMRGEKSIKKKFYLESEWRYVPKHSKLEPYLKKEGHGKPDVLQRANENSKNLCLLKFSPKDVRYIFVKRDADIPKIMDHIESELDLEKDEAKILASRVLSLEGLHADL